MGYCSSQSRGYLTNILPGQCYSFELKCDSTTIQICPRRTWRHQRITPELSDECGRVVRLEPRARAPPVSMCVILPAEKLRTSPAWHRRATELLLELTAHQTFTGKVSLVNPGEHLIASCSKGICFGLKKSSEESNFDKTHVRTFQGTFIGS